MVELLENSSVATQIHACHKCSLAGACYMKLLDEHKVRPVPGEGPADAKLVFVARNPGLDEDQACRPLVGASGQGPFAALLKEFGVSRKEVGIVNTVSCFTPEPRNRPPTEAEISFCRPNLVDQLNFFSHRRVVVTLGSEATKSFLGPKITITTVEGIPWTLEGSPVVYVPIRHPSFFLRDRSEAKRFGRLKLPRIAQAIKKAIVG